MQNNWNMNPQFICGKVKKVAYCDGDNIEGVGCNESPKVNKSYRWFSHFVHRSRPNSLQKNYQKSS